ncbi:hypothetical protein P2G88_01075 [Aliiglaciecola sp. CAU 1673]|nr:hypothetical protein [Aliiglaciecola sp. CAU 1673]
MNHKKYAICNDEYFGKRLNLYAPFDDEILSVIKQNDIKSVLLNCSFGWPAGSIDFLEEIKGVKGIYLYDNLIQDLTPLEYLSDLEVVYLECPKVKKSCRFDFFDNLKDLRVDWRACFSSLFNCSHLETLVVNNFAAEDLGQFCVSESLTRLDIIKSKIISVDGIGNLRKLKSLCLYGCSKLLDISAVSQLDLERIEIKSCKKVEKLDPIFSISSIEEVDLDGCGAFSSDRNLKNLRSLKLLNLGDVYFEDGELHELPRLDGVDVWLKNKKHYSHSFNQLTRNFLKK